MPSGIYELNQSGWKHSEEAKQKISEANKGKIMSEETRKKMSESKKGDKNPAKILETRQKISKAHKGLMVGKKNWRWVKDRTKLQKYGDDNKDRRSSAYRNWRMQIWLRDNFKCKIANQDCNGKIEAHHILGYTEYAELRYEINNGITLCHAHHPRERAKEKRLVPIFQGLVSVSNV